ncbi:MAG TPA: hypothetical protein VGM03_23305 [Phycisphaerae bacterium]|jgi:hypothetical protein
MRAGWLSTFSVVSSASKGWAVVLAVATLLSCACERAWAQPVTNAFTYQGRLQDGGSPANGSYDLRFRLLTALTGGSQVGVTLCRDNVAVANGLFTVELDFGAQFAGDQRFLEVGVRADSTIGNCAAGSYTILSPRQPLTVSPYAAYSLRAANGSALDAADGNPVNALVVDNNGNVGINTTGSIFQKLTVENGGITVTSGPGLNRVISSVDANGNGQLSISDHTGSLKVSMGPINSDPNLGGKVLVHNAAGTIQAGMDVNSLGQGIVFADMKNFRVPNPADPNTEIWYACIEGPEAAAYVRGTARLAEGRAVVKFPEHFAALINAATLTVQLTPRAAESEGLAVVDRRESGFTVQELRGGRGDYEFDWRAEAVRKGHEDYEVIRAKLVGQ